MPTTDLPHTPPNGNSNDSNGGGEPPRLPVLPLPDGVILPDMVVTVTMQSPEARQILAAVSDGRILLVPRIDGVYAKVGVIATIENQDSLPDGSPTITLRAHDRARVGAGSIGSIGGLWVGAEPVVDPVPDDETIRLATTYRAAATSLLDKVGGRRMAGAIPSTDQAGTLADSIAYWPDLSIEQRVELLETIDVKERLRLATAWVKEALAELSVREKIHRDVTDDLESSQREAILRRQMAAIQSELGNLDGADGDAIGTYRAKLAELLEAEAVSEATASAIEREIDRLERTGNESMESNWIRTWLDNVFGIPWTERSTERLDLREARSILDADHTGLDEVKDRLIEHLAVRKLRADRAAEITEVADGEDESTDDASAETAGVDDGARRRPSTTVARRGGAILALVGPPGVGKTSLGESVARSLGRSFVRLALGGVRDEAEIRGHRRTYVGARPGRLVAALTEAGSMNPVILLDEIDKVSGGWQGDPSAALLEVLDPAQNHSFRDHYLEFELDLSDVVFIATANVLDTIPGPLLDRMEIISLDGYTEIEKTTIAQDHLLPRLVERNGLRPGEVALTDEAVTAVVNHYTREAGVRRLERQLDKVLRKSVTTIAMRDQDADSETGSDGESDGAEPIVITDEDLADLLGKPIPEEDVSGRIDRPGMATGLAVTGAGGDVLFVETALVDGEGEPILTGQLGDVMKESATIVRSVVATRAEQLGVSIPEGKRLHVHFPAGAVPKDGPSAGVTMTTALTSLLTGRTVRSDVAMTGEVTLQGRVLPIGGVKQKVLAAHRAGITTVLLPKANERDLEDVPGEVAEAIDIHLVGDIDQVLELALEPAPAEAAAV